MSVEVQSASKSAAARKLARDRKRREEDERFAALCGPVTISHVQDRHPGEETGLVYEDE